MSGTIHNVALTGFRGRRHGFTSDDGPLLAGFTAARPDDAVLARAGGCLAWLQSLFCHDHIFHVRAGALRVALRKGEQVVVPNTVGVSAQVLTIRTINDTNVGTLAVNERVE